MAQHLISISVINSSTGTPQQANGVMMIFCQAGTQTSNFLFNTPYLLTQLSDLTDRGVNAAYDYTYGTYIYGQVRDFYSQAGAGALLWLVGVQSNTAYATYVASATFTQMVQFTALADPLNRAKMIGFCYAPPTLVTSASAFTGSGLNDLYYNGAYNQASLPAAYTVVIDGNAGIGTATVTAGGTGYVVGDTITVTQSGATGGTLKVSAVTAGAVTGVTMLTPGSAYSVASGLATTGGTGTGCTVAIATLCDTFKWKLNAGSYTTKVSTIGNPALSNGVTVNFLNTTGHTINDQWVITYSLGNANTTTGTDFPVDVTNTQTALQAAQLSLFNQGYQFSAIIDGYNMNWTATPSSLLTQATKNDYSISLCITGTNGNGVSAVGLALGRFARISIGHGVGAVADGPMVADNAFLTNGVSLQAGQSMAIGNTYTVYNGTVLYNSITYQTGQSFTAVSGYATFTTADSGYLVCNSSYIPSLTFTSINQLGQKQFFFLRTWANHTGFYWNDGATCTADTNQLSSQEYNRVVNALAADALAFFIDQMGANLPLQANGAVAQGYLNTQQALFYNTFITPLVNSGDISNASLVLTAPNFNATKTMYFTLTIQPSVILGNVVGTIKFSSTL